MTTMTPTDLETLRRSLHILGRLSPVKYGIRLRSVLTPQEHDDVAMSNAERQRRWRDRQRGGPPEKAGHGTRARAAKHRRDGEPPCDECLAAERAYNAEIARQRRAADRGA